jgi:hypothetical protein
MFLHPHLPNSRLGFLALLGLMLIVATEVTLRTVDHDHTMMVPHSWWFMTGYVVAAIYCIVVHSLITHREKRLGYDDPGADHTLAAVPIRYWSIIYLLFGLLRVAGGS